MVISISATPVVSSSTGNGVTTITVATPSLAKDDVLYVALDYGTTSPSGSTAQPITPGQTGWTTHGPWIGVNSSAGVEAAIFTRVASAAQIETNYTFTATNVGSYRMLAYAVVLSGVDPANRVVSPTFSYLSSGSLTRPSPTINLLEEMWVAVLFMDRAASTFGSYTKTGVERVDSPTLNTAMAWWDTNGPVPAGAYQVTATSSSSSSSGAQLIFGIRPKPADVPVSRDKVGNDQVTRQYVGDELVVRSYVGSTLVYGVGPDPSGPEAIPLVQTDQTKMTIIGSSTFASMIPQFTTFASDRDMDLLNGANGGILAEHMLARWGSRPMTADAFTIPASGSATFNSPNVQSDLFNAFSMEGYFEGFPQAPGTVSKPGGGGTALWTFTRTNTGTAVTVPTDTKFVPSLGTLGRQSVILMNLGKNNLSGGVAGGTNAVDLLTEWSQAAYDYVNTTDKRVLVVGHFQDTNTPSSSAARTRIDQYNAAMASAFGTRFVDLKAYITGPDVWTHTGLAPTATDQSQQALGNKPPSLSEYDAGVLDPLHLSEVAKAAVLKYLIGPKLVSLGWVPEVAVPEDTFEPFVDIPDATNTGTGIVRVKPTRVYPQTDYVVKANGEQVTDWIINGVVDTAGFDDVLIENNDIRGSSLTSGAGFLVKTSNSNRVTVQFNEIHSVSGYGGAMGIGTGNYTSYRNNIHHVSDSHRVNLTGTATPDPMLAVIECNYTHDAIMDTPDPAQARTDLKTHSDQLVQIEGGSGVRIRGNRATGLHSTDGTSSVVWTEPAYPFKAVAAGTADAIRYMVTTSAIMISPNSGWTVSNVQIDKNWLGGGEVTINGTANLQGTSSITNNVFDRTSLQETPIYQRSPAGVTVTGNKYADGLAV